MAKPMWKRSTDINNKIKKYFRMIYLCKWKFTWMTTIYPMKIHIVAAYTTKQMFELKWTNKTCIHSCIGIVLLDDDLQVPLISNSMSRNRFLDYMDIYPLGR